MTTDSRQKLFRRFAVITTVLIVVQVFFWVWDGFRDINYRIYDGFIQLQTSSRLFKPVYNNLVVHVDIDDTSINALQDYTLDRSYHARVIRNLAAMGVRFQLHDFIFAGRTEPDEDQQLVEAVRAANACYIGLAFSFDRGMATHAAMYRPGPSGREWIIKDNQAAQNIPTGSNAILSFKELSAAAKGIGFLNITPDSDGIFRTTPLLVRVDEGLLPSLALRLICDFLSVSPEMIHLEVVNSGLLLRLEQAVLPGGEGEEALIIPLDHEGKLRLNFIGPWEAMNHYHFSDIWRASDDQEELELWRHELEGKIAVVSQTATGSTDIGAVPTDRHYPLSGINSTVIHTILSKAFIRELSPGLTVPVQLVLVLVLAFLSLHRSTALFIFSSAGMICCIWLFGAWLFMANHLVVQLFSSLIVCLFAAASLQLLRAYEDSRAVQVLEVKKRLVEKELEIGRDIQAGFFPETLPIIEGWEVDAFFRPARQVAGDFYDVFQLSGSRYTAVVLADVCDKGVGAALFMALTRSLLRATALDHQGSSELGGDEEKPGARVERLIQRSVSLTSDYIAVNHTSSGMFATVFMGVVDAQTSTLYYSNCGHEPPVVFRQGGGMDTLKPTGPAIGLFPDMEFGVENVVIEPGELVFVYTDGLTDAQDSAGGLFNKERLLDVVSQNRTSVHNTVEAVKDGVDSHIGSTEQYDDITMVVLRRNMPEKNEAWPDAAGAEAVGR